MNYNAYALCSYGNTMPNGKVDAEEKQGEMEIGEDGMAHATVDSREDFFRKKREKEEYDWIAKLLKPYSSFIVRYPSVIVTLTMIVVALSIVLSVVKETGAKEPPDFSDPVKGYEARGTMLSARRLSSENLRDAYYDVFKKRRRRSTPPSNRVITPLNKYVTDFTFFYKQEHEGNLFNHMIAVCQWYKEKVTTQLNYPLYIERVHHIPNYIALLSNRTDCEHITANDVDSFVSLLTACAGYYENDQLVECMYARNVSKCNSISNTCRNQSNLPNPQDMATLLYNVFHFLGDIKLKDDPTVLKLTASVAEILSYDGIIEFFYQPIYENMLKNLEDTNYKGIQIAAFQMRGLKFNIFKTEMLVQSALLVIAIAVVILLTWSFSGSLFLGLMTLGCILMAMIISFFVYTRIFAMDFFPFLNMTVLIFIIGIGADDVFVYTGAWHEAKQIYKIANTGDHIEYMIKWTTHSLRHGVVAMLVTSLTTSAAFFSNITSKVVAVKCFGLFAGSAIIVNYMLMVTFFPCAVVLHDRYFSVCMHFCCPMFCKRLPAIDMSEHKDAASTNNNDVKKIKIGRKCEGVISGISHALFNEFLPRVVCRFKYIFIVVFFVIGVGAIVVSFGKPGLNPPITAEFQMFSSSSPLEQYDLYVKRKFAYGVGSGFYERDIDFVFGVELVDNSYKFNPDDNGKLVLKNEFDIAPEQLWLKQFCKNIQASSFYTRSSSCSEIEYMFDVYTSPCRNGFSMCCNKTLPAPNKEFMECFINNIMAYSETRPLVKDGKLRAFVIGVQTKFTYSRDYQENQRIIEELDAWTNIQMNNVSDSFKGWWHGSFLFYDLQNSLFEGTKLSLGIAVAVAFLVILVTSMNLVLSLFSIITILFVISTTVGTLIFDGWYLNIIESTVFSVAAGLSADFTLHYSVAYQSSLHKGKRQVRVEYALSHIGAAILMGAITTFMGGIVMLPSTVLSYTQFGTFLMVAMFFSWMYSTFFFLPVCAAMGPTNSFGQLTCRKEKKTVTSVQLTVVNEAFGNQQVEEEIVI